jgi:hypothetical protein
MGLGDSVVSSNRRLIPRWYAATVVGLLAVFTLVLVGVTAAFGGGLEAVSMWGLSAASALALVAAVSALVRPRRRREPEVATDGSRVFRAPALTAWALVGAWFALLFTAALWGWLAVTDFDTLESPARGPAGVRIELRGASAGYVVAPATAFDVPADQLVEEVGQARRAARR